MKKLKIFLSIMIILHNVTLFTQVYNAMVNRIPTDDITVTEKVELISKRPVIDIIKEEFPTFYKHLKAAGPINSEDYTFVDFIENAPLISVFVPTEEAFKKLNQIWGKEAFDAVFSPTTDEGRQKLQRILKLHIIPTRLLAEDIMEMESIQPISRTRLNVKTQGGVTTINEAATLVEKDIIGTNGVIHAMDAVIMP